MTGLVVRGRAVAEGGADRADDLVIYGNDRATANPRLAEHR
jgi:hypothetical protein